VGPIYRKRCDHGESEAADHLRGSGLRIGQWRDRGNGHAAASPAATGPAQPPPAKLMTVASTRNFIQHIPSRRRRSPFLVPYLRSCSRWPDTAVFMIRRRPSSEIDAIRQHSAITLSVLSSVEGDLAQIAHIEIFGLAGRMRWRRLEGPCRPSRMASGDQIGRRASTKIRLDQWPVSVLGAARKGWRRPGESGW